MHKKTGQLRKKNAACLVQLKRGSSFYSVAGWLKIGVMLIAGLMTGNCAYAQWTQLGIDIDGEAANDQSGWAVSLSADGLRLAIGAPLNDGTGNAAGHVRVYEWNGTQWNQMGNDIDGEAAIDNSGQAVSLSADGSRLAIGAHLNDGTDDKAGHVRIYEWNGTQWNQVGNDIDGEAANDQSGWAVSLSSDGNRVAIGALFNDGTAADAGHVRVYEWNGTQWNQMGNDIDGEAASDDFGYSVSLSSDGNRVAIGAHLNDGTAADAGHVRVYEWNGTQWNQMGSDIDGEAENDISGSSVSLSSDGNRVAIGAPVNDGTATSSGHVRVYEWNGTQWNQMGSDIDGEALYDNSGHSVSLSADGSRVVIGGPYNVDPGFDGGHVRVYEWDGAQWTQLGIDIDGEAANDFSGWSVSLSSDGNRVAIGAPFNSGTGSSAGHVRVYEVASSGNDDTAPLPLMPVWQLLLWGLLILSLSVLAIRKSPGLLFN